MQIANKFIELLEKTKSFLYNSPVPQYRFRDMHAKLYQISSFSSEIQMYLQSTASTELQIKNFSLYVYSNHLLAKKIRASKIKRIQVV